MTYDRILQNVAKHIWLDQAEEERFVSLRASGRCRRRLFF
jgi:hypothetical protein